MAAEQLAVVSVEDLPDDLSSLGQGSGGSQPVQVSTSFSTAMAGLQIVHSSATPQLPGSLCVEGQTNTLQEMDLMQMDLTKLLSHPGWKSSSHDDREALIVSTSPEVNEESETFVELESFKEAMRILKHSKFLLIVGPPGSGKTSLAHGLMRKFRERNMVAIPVKRTGDLTSLLAKENQILLIDDIFGKEISDRSRALEWADYFTTIGSQEKRNKFIFTSRTDRYTEYRSFIRRHPIFSETNKVDLSQLSPPDKIKLLQKHAEVAVAKGKLKPDHCLRGEMLTILSEMSTPHGFPSCVQLFISLHHQMENPCDFFHRPLAFLKDELHNLWLDNKAAFGALLLAVQDKGRLDQSLLDEYSVTDRQELVRCLLRTVGFSEHTTLHDITEASDRLRGTYFTQPSEDRRRELVLSHPSIYEAVLFVFGEQYPWHVPGLASLEFIINRVSICTVENKNREKIILEEKYFDRLAVKFYFEILQRRFPMVATHPAFGCKKFIEVFQKICEKEKDQGLLHAVIAQDEKYEMPLLYWSTWNKHGKLFKWVVRQLKQLADKGSEKEQRLAKGLLKMTPLRNAAIACCMNGNKEALEFMFSISNDFRQRMIHGLGNYPGSLPVPSFEDFDFPKDERKESTDVPHRQSLVHIAALHNNLNIISYLLDECCADVNGGMKIMRGEAQQQNQDHQGPAEERKKVGRTPLHVAARYGHVEVAKKLIEKRADLLVPTEAVFGLRTALHEACNAGHAEVVQTLIQVLKEKNQLKEAQQKRAQFGHTPLHSAVYSKNPEVVQILLKNEGDVEVCDDKGNTPLHLACEIPGNDEVLKVLLQSDADPVARNKDMNVPMHILCQKALDEKMLRTLLQCPTATAHVFNKKRLTPLHMACEKEALSIIPVLLEHGAVVNAEDNKGMLPINMTLNEKVHKILIDFVKTASAQATDDDVGEEESAPESSVAQSP